MAGARAQTTRYPTQWFALVAGAVYLVVGIVGFFKTGFVNFASNTTTNILGFDVNPLHNIVHILLGVVWLVGARAPALSRLVNLVLGGALLLVFVLGLFGALKWLSIDGAAEPDNFLHLVTGLVSLYFGSVGAYRTQSGAVR